MESLFLLLLLTLIVIFWFESLRIREYVIARCQQVCKEANLQLLDQTVALVTMSVKRASKGSLHLYRKYQFEVSQNGIDRHKEYVTLLGKTITSIHFEGPDGKNVIHQSQNPTLH